MISFGSQSKFAGNISKSLSQVAKVASDIQVRGYADHKSDEDIKWQWAVRDSPCQTCYKFKPKKSWISKIFVWKNNKGDELTNRHKEVKYEPKIWELQYYNYLLPDCDKISLKSGTKLPQIHLKTKDKLTKSKYYVCDTKNKACEGKQQLVNLERDDELKYCTEKLHFQLKEPFCLNEVCGKIKPHKKKDNDDHKPQFLCLNHLVDKPKCEQEASTKKSNECE